MPENYEPYYPGDEWVDWVGISMYLDWYVSGDKNQPADRDNPLDMVKGIYQRYADRKPIMIAEWGAANREYTTHTDRDQWAIANIHRYYAGLPRLYPGVKAVFYFSVDQEASTNPLIPTVWSSYLLSGKPAIREAYKQATAGSHYLSRIGDTASLGYREVNPEGDRLDPGTYKLSATVKLYDPLVSRVEYRIDGRAIGSATAAPYELAHDFTPYDGRKVTLTVRAYNSAGQLEGEAAHAIQVGLSNLADHWAGPQIRELVARKIVSGYPDATFRPEEPISREEMAVLVARAAGLAPAAEPGFGDTDQIRAEWRTTVGAAVEAKLLTGFADNTYRPTDGANRAQAAVVILRLLNQTNQMNQTN